MEIQTKLEGIEYAVFFDASGNAIGLWHKEYGMIKETTIDSLKNTINDVVDVSADITIYKRGSKIPCCYKSASGKLWCWC
jgi:hypothetical protein